MIVEKILAHKGRHVVIIEPDRSLIDAADLLTQRGIGAVVVGDRTNAVLGILSERDIVRAIASSGKQILDQPVSSIMTKQVITCTGQMPLREALAIMTERKFRHIPVVEEGLLSGIISIGDVVKFRLEQIEAESRAMRDYIATA